MDLSFKIDPYPKQIQFFNSTKRYIAYGGARGGGKSWAARTKALLMALDTDKQGIQILFLRRTLNELRENHLYPMLVMLKPLIDKGIVTYRDKTKEFLFPNASRIIFGYCDAESDVLQYQGQAYDVIFMEEATQFTQFQYDTLTESNRLSGMMKKKFTPRMYLTCNPGGVGHIWVKRLFIDKQYQKKEKAENYDFIPSSVYENEFLMQNNPEYVENLENLPEMRKRAMLYGDWDAFEGQYFSEFNRDIHVIEPIELPHEWKRFISIDYGLDMLACYWIAVDTHSKAYVYKELYQSGLIISEAAKAIKKRNGEDVIACRYAPPDLWNRRQETGKSAIDIFAENGLGFVKSNNDRVQGWYSVKEYLKPYTDEQGIKTANLVIFKNCTNLIRTLPQLQCDENNPNDVSTEPHELTHAPDAIRGFCTMRHMPTIIEKKQHYNWEFEKPKPAYGEEIADESYIYY
jgi:phage terminase large subunit